MVVEKQADTAYATAIAAYNEPCSCALGVSTFPSSGQEFVDRPAPQVQRTQCLTHLFIGNDVFSSPKASIRANLMKLLVQIFSFTLRRSRSLWLEEQYYIKKNPGIVPSPESRNPTKAPKLQFHHEEGHVAN